MPPGWVNARFDDLCFIVNSLPEHGRINQFSQFLTYDLNPQEHLSGCPGRGNEMSMKNFSENNLKFFRKKLTAMKNGFLI